MSDEVTFYEHLDELIRRPNVCLAAIILPLVSRVLDIMKELFLPEGTTLIVVNPFENIMVFFELALVLGLLFSSPVMIYEALKFIFKLEGYEEAVSIKTAADVPHIKNAADMGIGTIDIDKIELLERKLQ